MPCSETFGRAGELVAVIGRPGSGKTALLHAVPPGVGEMPSGTLDSGTASSKCCVRYLESSSRSSHQHHSFVVLDEPRCAQRTASNGSPTAQRCGQRQRNQCRISPASTGRSGIRSSSEGLATCHLLFDIGGCLMWAAPVRTVELLPGQHFDCHRYAAVLAAVGLKQDRSQRARLCSSAGSFELRTSRSGAITGAHCQEDSEPRPLGFSLELQGRETC